jgi:replicative DNA helicase
VVTTSQFLPPEAYGDDVEYDFGWLDDVATNGSAPAARLPFERLVDVATFVRGDGRETVPVWGTDSSILWAAGEPLMLYGPDGVGKTTIGQQLALARAGLRRHLLGHSVAADPRGVLYIAADRPRQAARSLARMLTGTELETIGKKMVVWRGPLPFDLSAKPDELLSFVTWTGCGSVFIDSLKDVALDLGKDETGARVNRAIQDVIAADIEVVLLHHPRKEPAGAPERPKTLGDVYGSRWIVAGMGSVVLIWGKAGDPIIDISHLKQPAEEVGPFSAIHDHARGHTKLHEPVDPLTLLITAGSNGLEVTAAATALYAAAKPDRNQVEKARRKLDALVTQGAAEKLATVPVRYFVAGAA